MIRAAKAEGLEPTGIEFDFANGRIIVKLGGKDAATPSATSVNEWDEVLPHDAAKA